MNRSDMSPTQLVNSLRGTGKKGSAILSILGKTQSFNKAINSPYGKVLLEDLMEMYEQALLRLASPDVTDDDRADFRAYKRMITRWINKIDVYQKSINALNPSDEAA